MATTTTPTPTPTPTTVIMATTTAATAATTTAMTTARLARGSRRGGSRGGARASVHHAPWELGAWDEGAAAHRGAAYHAARVWVEYEEHVTQRARVVGAVVRPLTHRRACKAA